MVALLELKIWLLTVILGKITKFINSSVWSLKVIIPLELISKHCIWLNCCSQVFKNNCFFACVSQHSSKLISGYVTVKYRAQIKAYSNYWCEEENGIFF